MGVREKEGSFKKNHTVHMSLHTFFTECIIAISPDEQKEKEIITYHRRLIQYCGCTVVYSASPLLMYISFVGFF